MFGVEIHVDIEDTISILNVVSAPCAFGVGIGVDIVGTMDMMKVIRSLCLLCAETN